MHCEVYSVIQSDLGWIKFHTAKENKVKWPDFLSGSWTVVSLCFLPGSRKRAGSKRSFSRVCLGGTTGLICFISSKPREWQSESDASFFAKNDLLRRLSVQQQSMYVLCSYVVPSIKETNRLFVWLFCALLRKIALTLGFPPPVPHHQHQSTFSLGGWNRHYSQSFFLHCHFSARKMRTFGSTCCCCGRTTCRFASRSSCARIAAVAGKTPDPSSFQPSPSPDRSYWSSGPWP